MAPRTRLIKWRVTTSNLRSRILDFHETVSLIITVGECLVVDHVGLVA